MEPWLKTKVKTKVWFQTSSNLPSPVLDSPS